MIGAVAPSGVRWCCLCGAWPVRLPCRAGAVLGGDISWPQCPKGMGIPEKRSLGLPMPLPSAQYVVIGLTNGPGFVANPCLADHVAWAKERAQGWMKVLDQSLIGPKQKYLCGEEITIADYFASSFVSLAEFIRADFAPELLQPVDQRRVVMRADAHRLGARLEPLLLRRGAPLVGDVAGVRVDRAADQARGRLPRGLGPALDPAVPVERRPRRRGEPAAGRVAADLVRLVEAEPDAGDERRGVADEPDVGALVGRPRLPGDGTVHAPAAQRATRPVVVSHTASLSSRCIATVPLAPSTLVISKRPVMSSSSSAFAAARPVRS